MRTKFSGILTLLLAFVVQLTFAQEKTISGTVSDNSGLPLPGVNIIVKGTSNGTQSDFDGNYTVNANVGQALVFSYVGFNSVERAVTAATSNISLQLTEDAESLEEVVVTALGIKKEKKALGYAVSSIKEEAIKDNPETDLTRVLQGKTAGIEITTQNGISGSANKVIIRGMNSFSGNNNALYVIDGVPYSNDTNASGDFVDGNSGSSRSFDIDPNNIENIDILKGLAATTLYGTDGRNGVILITTKTGSTKNISAKQEVNISTSYFFNEVASLPDYQDKYGGGFDQAFGWFYSNWGPGFYEEGLGGWGSDAAFDENGTLAHPYSTSAFLGANYPDYQALYEGARYDWKPRNSVEQFFKTGGVSSISANFKGRSEDNKFNYGMAFGQVEDEGFTPGNKVTRTNLTVSGGAKLTNKLNVRGSMTYTKTNFKTPPVAASFGSSTFGSGSSIFGDLYYTPRSIDFYELPYEAPDGSSIYYRDDNAIQHPLWTIQNAKFSQNVNRLNGFASLDYNFNDNINLRYQGSIDTYSENNVNKQNRGGRTGDLVTDSGFYSTWNNTNLISDHNLVLSGNNYSFLNDNLGFNFMAGATSRNRKFDRIGIDSFGQQVFDFFNHEGFTDYGYIEYHEERNIVGLYGQLSFDVNNWVFLNLSGRQDWVSNTSKNNTLFYPSASMSFIPTSAFKGMKSDKGINYMKLRVGYGTSANFSSGYPTATGLSLNTQGWLDETENTTNSFVGNPNIKPELFAEVEYGVEMKLFSRVNLDLTYFTRITEDLIIGNNPIPLSTGAGFTSTNVGEIKSWGIEAELGLDVLKRSEGFNWNVNVNFFANESEVTDIGDNDILIYAGFTNLGNGARVGYPLGAMFGSRIARDEDGNLLVDGVGNYLADQVDEDGVLPFIGDPNPDFVMNYTNTFEYKGLSLGFAINHTSGGDIYSTTTATLMGRGLTTDTENRLSTYILPGVNINTGLPNDIQINNSNFYFDNGFASPADELSVYDGSVVRLREVNIAYSLPSKLLNKTPFGKVTIKASAFNMWYNAYNTPDGVNFDPNTTGLGAGNGQGFEFLTGPSSKRYGMSVNLSF
ncbi:SusC/RagA family TonB-linked outer membrane protein [Flavobacteriaceae bacterium]|nr:SusC/RagA family TonB-linked outer membrane protein [Flavobacteriaceae bacterium]MDC6467851.1 SusC/RagA family TonB-linked outer membrane protein [Flavobacteriaceae bacterium]